MSKEELNENWTAYSEYNKVLRAWFVAFGIGVPATFLINSDLIKYISHDTGNPSIFYIFLLGASAQVVMAFINKTINWCTYYKERNFPNSSPKGFWKNCARVFSKFNNWYFIDFICDLITIGCFSVSIYKLILLITVTSNLSLLTMDHIELLKEYEKRLALQSWEEVEDLIHEDAVFIFSDGTYRGIEEIKKVFTRNFNTIKDENYLIKNLEWITQAKDMASCIYEFSWIGIINDKEASGAGRGSSVLIKSDKGWQIIQEHLGPYQNK